MYILLATFTIVIPIFLLCKFLSSVFVMVVKNASSLCMQNASQKWLFNIIAYYYMMVEGRIYKHQKNSSKALV